MRPGASVTATAAAESKRVFTIQGVAGEVEVPTLPSILAPIGVYASSSSTVESVRDEPMRPFLRDGEVFSDFSKGVAVEIPQAQDATVTRPQPRKDLARGYVCIERQADGDVWDLAVAVSGRAGFPPPVVTAGVADGAHEPRVHIPNVVLPPNECEEDIVQQPFGIVGRHFELGDCNPEEERSSRSIKSRDVYRGKRHHAATVSCSAAKPLKQRLLRRL